MIRRMSLNKPNDINFNTSFHLPYDLKIKKRNIKTQYFVNSNKSV